MLGCTLTDAFRSEVLQVPQLSRRRERLRVEMTEGPMQYYDYPGQEIGVPASLARRFVLDFRLAFDKPPRRASRGPDGPVYTGPQMGELVQPYRTEHLQRLLALSPIEYPPHRSVIGAVGESDLPVAEGEGSESAIDNAFEDFEEDPLAVGEEYYLNVARMRSNEPSSSALGFSTAAEELWRQNNLNSEVIVVEEEDDNHDSEREEVEVILAAEEHETEEEDLEQSQREQVDLLQICISSAMYSRAHCARVVDLRSNLRMRLV